MRRLLIPNLAEQIAERYRRFRLSLDAGVDSARLHAIAQQRQQLALHAGAGLDEPRLQESAPVAPPTPAAQNILLFDRAGPQLFIKTSFNYYSTMVPNSLALTGMAAWGFEVDNQTDQTLTWQIIGGSYPDASTMGQVGASGTIATLTTVPILTDIWYRFLSLTILFTTLPTTGAVNVRASADPRG